MGFFTTVTARLVCARCGGTFAGDVQFKTGSEASDLPVFREGEQVAGIAAGTYEGIADAYCHDCIRAWCEDEKRSNFIALAEAVASGVVVVRRGRICKDPDKVPIDELGDFTITYVDAQDVTPAEITSSGVQSDGERSWRTFAARLSDLRYVVSDGSGLLHPTRVRLNSDWWDRQQRRVAALMTELDWPLGEVQWSEPKVSVSPSLVIGVERP